MTGSAAPASGQPGKMEEVKVGKSTSMVSPVIADKVRKADAAYFKATGKHLQINQSYRTRAQQEKLYNDLSKKGARVAKPGTSFHEKGQAIDVTNWKEAEKYLNEQGLVNPMADDKGHFSFGEFNV
jgi:D-alanyl-D-alanine dipeptidase